MKDVLMKGTASVLLGSIGAGAVGHVTKCGAGSNIGCDLIATLVRDSDHIETTANSAPPPFADYLTANSAAPTPSGSGFTFIESGFRFSFELEDGRHFTVAYTPALPAVPGG
jgi:hypothetical protein